MTENKIDLIKFTHHELITMVEIEKAQREALERKLNILINRLDSTQEELRIALTENSDLESTVEEYEEDITNLNDACQDYKYEQSRLKRIVVEGGQNAGMKVMNYIFENFEDEQEQEEVEEEVGEPHVLEIECRDVPW